MKLNFCIQCGKPLELKSIGDEGEQKYCEDCGKFYFDNPACVVLIAIINENSQVLLLRQKYISEKWVLCSGYVKMGDTLEETVAREVLEETGQTVITCEYINSYYFAPKDLIMPGFIAYVKSNGFNVSNEVDELMWCDPHEAVELVERKNNFSGIHLDNCIKRIIRK